jgi:hypothetical protein
MQVWCQPWKNPLANLVDTASSVALISMMICGIAMLPEADLKDAENVAIVGLLSFLIGMFLLLVLVIMQNVPAKWTCFHEVDRDLLADDAKQVFDTMCEDKKFEKTDSSASGLKTSAHFVQQLSEQDTKRLRGFVDRLRRQFAGDVPNTPRSFHGIRPPTILTSQASSSSAKEDSAKDGQQGAENTV